MRAILCQLFVLLEKSSNLFVILLVNFLYCSRCIRFYYHSFPDCEIQRLASWKRCSIYPNWYKWKRKPKIVIELLRYEALKYVSNALRLSESDNRNYLYLLLIIAR